MIIVETPKVADEHEPGCEFGLCRRPAELKLIGLAGEPSLLVCVLHIDPILTWGVA